jgi:dCMP deaminase
MKLNITNNKNKNKFIKPAKYDWIEHAERNAIFNALNNGVSLQGSICITTLVPCIDCTKAIISSGISKIYTFKPNDVDSKWLQ